MRRLLVLLGLAALGLAGASVGMAGGGGDHGCGYDCGDHTTTITRTVTLPGTTVTLPSSTTTVTTPGPTTTTTTTLPAVTTAGPTTTVTTAGQTVTTPGPTSTVTQTVAAAAVTLPAATVPGPTVTVPGKTIKVKVPGKPVVIIRHVKVPPKIITRIKTVTRWRTPKPAVKPAVKKIATHPKCPAGTIGYLGHCAVEGKG